MFGLFIIGLPGSSKESEEKSLKLAKELNWACWSFATPYPNTELYNKVKDKIIKNVLDEATHLSWGMEPFFELDGLSRKELKRIFIVNNLKTKNYFLVNIRDQGLSGLINLFLNLRYDLPNLPKHMLLIAKQSIKLFFQRLE